MNADFKIDFIGIGAPKCGTTWISRCLEEHPEICLSDPKEPMFFNRKDIEPRNNLDQYRHFFWHYKGEKVKGEFSVSYFRNELARHRIKELFPNIKLIISLRNPIERAVSTYIHSNRYNPKALKRNINQSLCKKFRHTKYVYSPHLKKWFTLFPRQNILVIIFRDIKKRPLEVIKRVYQFLEVDSSFTPSIIKKKIYSAHTYYFPTVQKPLRSIYRKSKKHPLFLKTIKRLHLDAIPYAIKSLNRKPYTKPKISGETREHLREIFEEDIQRTESIIGRNLNFWK